MPLTIPRAYSLEADGLSQSLIQTCMTCPRKFLFRINGYTSKAPMSSAITFGNIMHEALEMLYRDVGYDRCNLHGIDEIIEKACTSFPSDDTEIHKAKSTALLEEYVNIYRSDFNGKSFIELEREFDLPYSTGDLKVMRRGKIDGVFETKGKLWLIEHKTKSRIDEDGLMLQLSFDFQNLFYVTVAEELYQKEVAGVLYNVIRTPEHRQGHGESLEEFTQRLGKEIRKAPDHFFKRYEVPYTQKDKQEFIIELNYKLNTLRRFFSDGCFFRNQNACDSKYGTCEFLTACATGRMITLKKDKLFPELTCGL